MYSLKKSIRLHSLQMIIKEYKGLVDLPLIQMAQVLEEWAQKNS